MYYCRGAVQSAHCAEYWPVPVKQCEYCEWYSSGYGAPHYPMPVVAAKCFFHPDYVNVVQYNGRQGIYGPGYQTIHEWVHPHCGWRYY